jgi:uncharacterized coiled-coil protein SlyX
MKEWLEKNREKIDYGLVILILILLVAIFFTRDTSSKEIARLNKANSVLETTASMNEEKITELTSANNELKSRITSLDKTLAKSNKEMNQLNDSISIRRKAMENMRNKIAELRRENNNYQRQNREDAGLELERLREIEKKLWSLDNTESALPAAPDAKSTIALKLSDTGALGGVVSDLSRTITTLSSINPRMQGLEKLIPMVDMIKDFAAATQEMSMLIIPSPNPDFYISFLADEDKFDEFISRPPNPYYNFEAWDTIFAPKEAWTFHVEGASKPLFYILKRQVGEKALVLLAKNEKAISEMSLTLWGKSPRFAVERATSGPNYYQVKFKDGFKIKDIADAFSFNPYMRTLPMGNTDKVLWTISECSWTREEDVISFDSYSDFLKQNPELTRTRKASTEPFTIFGDGDLAYFVSIDAGLLLHCVFLGSDDPAGQVYSLLSGLGGAAMSILSEKDIKEILANSKLSIACVANGKKISTAYLMLETDASETINKLFKISDSIGGSGAKIPGWSDAISLPLQVPGIPDIVMAKNDGAIMFGLGDESSFEHMITIPESYKDYVLRDNIVGLLVSSKLMDVVLGLIDVAAEQSGKGSEDDEILVKHVYSVFSSMKDSFDVICGNVKSSERSEGKIVLKEGGDIVGSYLELMTLNKLATDSAAERAEATKVINDLRNLKASSLLFYGDNTEWPEEKDVERLDKYLDRPIISSNRYEKVTIGPEYKDSTGNVKVNIGVQLWPNGNGAEGIRKKLESRASQNGLLQKADEDAPYKMDSLTIYINMR